jgi:cell division protein FtsB
MRIAPYVLLLLLVIIHAQLWLGRGSVPEVMGLKSKLLEQKALNDKAFRRNEQVLSEVSDLKDGLETVEEKARSELGMVKPNEIFVQITKPKAVTPPAEAGGPAEATAKTNTKTNNTPSNGKPAANRPAQ